MSIMELLADLTSGTNGIIRAAASKHNLTASQVFHILSIPFDGISMTSLAHKLGLDTSTLTRNIQNLMKLGLVKRQIDAHDRRVHLVTLTNDGFRLIESLDRQLEEINQHLLNKIIPNKQFNIIIEYILDSLLI